MHHDGEACGRAPESVPMEYGLQLRALSDNLPGGLVYQIDSGPDGAQRTFTYLSGGVAQLHEVSLEAVLRDPRLIYAQIHPEDVELVSRAEKAALETMTPLRIDVRVILPSGRRGWRHFTSAPRRLANGHLVWDGIEFDITERKRAEAEREDLQSQLLQAQKMESIGRLAGGVAHDFNNMLGAILGNTELAIQRIAPGDPLLALLLEIRKAAERSADLTRQLLAFARKQTVEPKVIDLNQTVASMFGMLQRLLGETVRLEFTPGKSLGAIRMDPSQFDQILANLCVNARDAVGKAGRLVIETADVVVREGDAAAGPDSAPGEYVLLQVSDDGCGMDAETRSRLFEPFFTTKAIGKGTGLGLATVYGIVRQNRGFITVSSAPGRGTTFRIYFPRCAAPAAPPDAAASRASSAGGRETVLLVDDERLILEVTANMLLSLGYRVLTAASPGEALRVAGEHRGEIHLLLTDVILPEMNGRDLANNIGALCPGIRRLFMSGHTDDLIAHHGVLEDGVHFLAKPFGLSDLARKTREALGRP